eukprot:30087-Pelagococcus_subviridis.AAC.10
MTRTNAPPPGAPAGGVATNEPRAVVIIATSRDANLEPVRYADAHETRRHRRGVAHDDVWSGLSVREDELGTESAERAVVALVKVRARDGDARAAADGSVLGSNRVDLRGRSVTEHEGFAFDIADVVRHVHLHETRGMTRHDGHHFALADHARPDRADGANPEAEVDAFVERVTERGHHRAADRGRGERHDTGKERRLSDANGYLRVREVLVVYGNLHVRVSRLVLLRHALHECATDEMPGFPLRYPYRTESVRLVRHLSDFCRAHEVNAVDKNDVTAARGHDRGFDQSHENPRVKHELIPERLDL